MKPILMKRSGLLLAVAMMVALACLGATGGSALAQTAGGGSQHAGCAALEERPAGQQRAVHRRE